MFERYQQILVGKEQSQYLVNSMKFDSLIAMADNLYQKCYLCEYRCGVNRHATPGRCGCRTAQIASHFFHYGEEQVLVPSYTIFFSGCNFRCVYCQNWDLSQHLTGMFIKPAEMRCTIQGVSDIAKNINWVGGEPTPHLLYILNVLKGCTANIPQVWNSNMYCTKETMDILGSIIDLYLTDFKYGNNICAKRLSNVDHYWEIVTRNHEQAHRQGEMIIRHLVIPGHVNCCSKPIIEWIAEVLPNIPVNLMNQYYPTYMAHKYSEINRYLSGGEYQEILRYAERIDLQIL